MKFAVIGIDHGHIHGQIRHVQSAGATFAGWYAEDPSLAKPFAERYPNAPQADSLARLMEDSSIELILTASIPSLRAEIGVAAMEHGKHVMADKPGMTTLEQLDRLRKVQESTQKVYSVCYSEHFDSAGTVRAGELVASGAIGRVVQTVGLGPHRANIAGRPAWFFDPEQYGGILTDIASHQFEQFLFFTGSRQAEVASSAVGNYRYPEHPGLEDYGEATLRGDGGHGFLRIDWYTPDGLSTWGDGRLTILGTEGYIEVRKYVDITKSPQGEHLFLVDQKGEHYIDCREVPLPYGQQLLDDISNGTESHAPQWRTFLAMELALKAEAQAVRLGHLRERGG